MKTLDELKAFCEGYRHLMLVEDMPSTDDWVIWGGYDLNIYGAEYSRYIDYTQLTVAVYPAGWTANLPDPLHTFII